MRADVPNLEQVWMPRLIESWRKLSGLRGKPDRLSVREINQVGEAVLALSNGLIGERELIGRAYMDDASHLGAYLLYFWPVSYAQSSFILKHLMPEDMTRGPVLDLGSGPGPMAMAAANAGAQELVLREKAQRSMDVGLKLAGDAGVKASGSRQDVQRLTALESSHYGLITMGHVLGELWSLDEEDAVARRVALCEELMGALKPGGHLVIMEPALRHTSRELLMVRDALIEAGHGVKAPCYFKGACPALERKRDWCHAELPWKMPKVVEQIAQAAGRRKEHLKMTYIIMQKGLSPEDQKPADPDVFRLVSESLHTKGRFHFVGCGAQGRTGITMLKRDKTPQNKTFIKKERWRVIRATSLHEHGDELRMDKHSVVSEAAEPFDPVPS
jgi:SAM-dependent methyltransferase